MVPSAPKLVLASASPRRSQLLCEMGVKFDVCPADIDENPAPGESPDVYVQRMALEKALLVKQGEEYSEYAVLSADTVVVQNQEIFSKPDDRDHAFHMWQKLSGTEHQVMTSICLLVDNERHKDTVSTSVFFDQISEHQMQRYWDSGEPIDKAGGYAIQGFASAWVKLIHGSYSNVVGLPLQEVNQLLKKIKLNWL